MAALIGPIPQDGYRHDALTVVGPVPERSPHRGQAVPGDPPQIQAGVCRLPEGGLCKSYTALLARSSAIPQWGLGRFASCILFEGRWRQLSDATMFLRTTRYHLKCPNLGQSWFRTVAETMTTLTSAIYTQGFIAPQRFSEYCEDPGCPRDRRTQTFGLTSESSRDRLSRAENRW